MALDVTEPAEPGLYLEVTIDAESANVTLAAEIQRVSRRSLRSPLLAPDDVARYKRPAAEIVLTLLDAAGAILDRFAWPGRAEAFVDRSYEGAGEGAIQGGPRDSRLKDRIIKVPIRKETLYLLFTQSMLRAGQGPPDAPLTFSQQTLGLYFIGAPGVPVPPPPIPPFPFPNPVPPKPFPLPFLNMAQRRARPLLLRNKNRIVDVQTLVNNGLPADHFDIVILGDGFAEGELVTYDARAQALANGLMAIPPFSTLASKINIHSVRAISAQSGITDCPGGGARNTYFGCRGNFNNEGFAGFVGTDEPHRIYEASEAIAPREQLEIFVVIANCAIDGGSAFPLLGLACVTMWADMPSFVNIAAHEMGHVLARSAEEYISCVADDPTTQYSNQATEAEKQADTVWWKSLGMPGELDSTGAFRAVHVHGDPFDGNNEPIIAPALAGFLGLYWGCQDIDPAAPHSSSMCDFYQEPSGAPFYRAMARCKMRRRSWDFCRVCSSLIEDVIRTVAP